MNNQHAIEEAVFDISFGSLPSTRDLESVLGAFVQSRLLPLAEEAFDEISADGMVTRIDTLEIDLGDINHRGFMEEMEDRFREKLKAELREKLQSFSRSHSPTEGRLSQIQAERGQLEFFLETGRLASNTDHLADHAFQEMLSRVIRGDGAKFIEFLKNAPHRNNVVKRLTRQFTETALAELMQLLSSGQEKFWGVWVEAIWVSWKKNLASVTESEFKSIFWELLIHEYLKSGNSVPDAKRLLGEISRLVFVQCVSGMASQDMTASSSEELLHQQDASNPASGGQDPRHRQRPVWPSSSPAGKSGGEGGATADAGGIFVGNAGLVLLAPYMPQLFRMLELTNGPQLKGEKAAERAIHLLQFTVNERCDSPEPFLVLNKILCGVESGAPISRGIEIQNAEKEAIEGMLKAIIQTWTVIGNTSVQGLRESFLQRGGRLQLKGDNWHLKVEQKGIDVLLDRLPWSFSIIKHPWMAQPVYVEWR